MSPISTISIILPTHNGAKYLKRAIDSCLGQTHKALELIIVNDGSTDATAQIINGYTDPRIRSIHFPKNQGIVAALNKGFAQAKGDLLTWTSDDNYYAPEAMAVMSRALQEDRRIDFVYACYTMVDEDGHILKPGHVEDPRGLDQDNYVGGCFLYRRRVYETIGDFNAEAFLVEDYEYWLRVRQRFGMKKLDDMLYYYRVHPNSLTTTHGLRKVQDQLERVRAAYIPSWKQDFFIGKRYFYQKDFSKSRRFLIKSLIGAPFYYQTWRLLVKGVLKK